MKAETVRKRANTESICSQLRAYRRNECKELIIESQFSSRVRATETNGFVRTVAKCYNEHHNLVIRPDDVWSAIMTQFSFYINKNAEEFRGRFVNFEGKKVLEVDLDGTLRSVPYDVFVTKMTDKIDENLVDKTVKDWILPNFTTTTTTDIISCGIIFMATTKKYFEYRGICACCGIPYVTLEGTVARENISIRLEKLKSYKLDKWYDQLKPVLEEFVAAKNGKPNIDFWTRICDVDGGSGPTYLSGWITNFAVFDEEGEWNNGVVILDNIPSGIVTVDVEMIELDGLTERKYKCILFAGHVAYKVLEDDVTLQPQIGWGVALKN